jgi:hypothetical protein
MRLDMKLNASYYYYRPIQIIDVPLDNIQIILETSNTHEKQSKHGENHGKDHVEMCPEIEDADGEIERS